MRACCFTKRYSTAVGKTTSDIKEAITKSGTSSTYPDIDVTKVIATAHTIKVQRKRFGGDVEDGDNLGLASCKKCLKGLRVDAVIQSIPQERANLEEMQC